MASSSHALAAEEDAIRVAPPELAPGVEDSAGTTNHVEQEEEEDSEAVDEDGEEEDFEEGDDDEEDGEDSESNIGASELEEEAQYADQPACGLSPRLVVRRACETLTANDPPKAGLGSNVDLKRVDTMVGFERAVGRVDPDELMSPAVRQTHEPKPLTREETMSGLPEVRDAFDAIAAETAADAGTMQPPPGRHSGSSTGTQQAVGAQPMPMHRVDTMELLADPSASEDPAGSSETRPTKRPRPS